jgi:hypothetical protein
VPVIEFCVTAEYSIDGSAWRPYRAFMRTRTDHRPAAESLIAMIERDILHCLGEAVKFVVVRLVRVQELRAGVAMVALKDVLTPNPSNDAECA